MVIENYIKKHDIFQKFINNRYFKLKLGDNVIYLIDANTGEIIMIIEYQVLGYIDDENKKFTYADENKFIEKNLTELSKEIKQKEKNLDYNKIIEELKKIINKYDKVKWILENKKKYVSNNNTYSITEYIIITNYLQVK